jgi:hypothetical protein
VLDHGVVISFPLNVQAAVRILPPDRTYAIALQSAQALIAGGGNAPVKRQHFGTPTTWGKFQNLGHLRPPIAKALAKAREAEAGRINLAG